MPLPAQYARLDGLIDIIVEAMVREIEEENAGHDDSPTAVPPADPVRLDCK
jgi:hypothetical protein